MGKMGRETPQRGPPRCGRHQATGFRIRERNYLWDGVERDCTKETKQRKKRNERVYSSSGVKDTTSSIVAASVSSENPLASSSPPM